MLPLYDLSLPTVGFALFGVPNVSDWLSFSGIGVIGECPADDTMCIIYIYMRVPPLVCSCFFPGAFLSSRVTGTCPMTTDLTMRVNVRTTTTTTRQKVVLVYRPFVQVAMQLGLLDDAVRLYRECGRYDLLNVLYQASAK